MISIRSHVRSFKGRRFNPRAPVLVYRNLNRKGQWYSVMQGGRVVGHTQFLCVNEPVFIVHKAGRDRAVRTGHRNVHAFVKGVISYTEMFFRDDRIQLMHRAGYLPRLGHFFVDYKSGYVDPFGETVRMGLKGATVALVSKDGLSVDAPVVFKASK